MLLWVWVRVGASDYGLRACGCWGFAASVQGLRDCEIGVGLEMHMAGRSLGLSLNGKQV